jgi:hypothetical protein
MQTAQSDTRDAQPDIDRHVHACIRSLLGTMSERPGGEIVLKVPYAEGRLEIVMTPTPQGVCTHAAYMRGKDAFVFGYYRHRTGEVHGPIIRE